MQRIIDYFRALIFDRRKRRAIREAQRSAALHRKKFLVLVHDGRPVCVSMQGIKRLIAQHRFAPGFTAEKARQIAIFEALPPTRGGKLNKQELKRLETTLRNLVPAYYE